MLTADPGTGENGCLGAEADVDPRSTTCGLLYRARAPLRGVAVARTRKGRRDEPLGEDRAENPPGRCGARPELSAAGFGEGRDRQPDHGTGAGAERQESRVGVRMVEGT